MSEIKLTADTARLNRRLSNMIARQIPFAVSRALNQTAKDLIAANKKDMQMRFDRPTNFTLNAFFFMYAKKGDTSVTIRRKSMQAGKHYLEVQESGGQRKMKGFERNFMYNLAYSGPISYITPTDKTPILSNGNMSMGFLRKVESQLRTASDPAMRMNTQKPRKRKARGKQYFVPDITHPLGQGRSAGVYERTPAGNVKKVLNFVTSTPQYTKRTRFHQNMPRWASKILPGKLRSSLRFAMETARF